MFVIIEYMPRTFGKVNLMDSEEMEVAIFGSRFSAEKYAKEMMEKEKNYYRNFAYKVVEIN